MVKRTSKKKVAEAKAPPMRVILMSEVKKGGKLSKPKAYTVVGQGVVPQKVSKKKKRRS